MTADVSPDKERVTIILHSGAYDRASYVLTLALAVLASGMEVHLLLTFERLRRFIRKHLAGMHLDQTQTDKVIKLFHEIEVEQSTR